MVESKSHLPIVEETFSKIPEEEHKSHFYCSDTLPPVNTPYGFFRQKRVLNFEGIIPYKVLELESSRRHRAATLIQSVFRGWLIRTNLKLLVKCAIKIQSLWRKAIAINKVRRIREEKRHEEDAKLRHKMASKIQGAYKGYISRKKKFDYKEYKKMKEKNESVKNYAEMMSSLEASVTPLEDSKKSQSGPKSDFYSGNNDEEAQNVPEAQIPQKICQNQNYWTDEDEKKRKMLEKNLSCLENVLRKNCGEELKDIPKERLNELLNYLTTHPKASKSEICLTNSLTKIFTPSNNSTGEEGGLHPSSETIELLKAAIRSLRLKIKEFEESKLYKLHYLVRTKARPGVLSDVFSSEETEIERKMRKLRFKPGEFSYTPPGKYVTEERATMSKFLYEETDEERKEMLEKIYNFKVKVEPQLYSSDLATMQENEVKVQRISSPPPPFTTLFKSRQVISSNKNKMEKKC